MLNKLIGHELKSTRRIFLPLYGIVLILALLNGIVFALDDKIAFRFAAPAGLLVTAYIMAIFAACVLTFAYMIYRFYKNLLGDEGYLMFTLPVRPSQLIWAKCLSSTLWMIVSAVVCVASMFLFTLPMILFSDNVIINFSGFWNGVQRLFEFYHFNIIAIPVEAIIYGLLYTANFCLHIYACLAIGSLANKHRLGFAFLAYLVFGIVKQLILIIGVSVGDTLPWNFNVFESNNITQIHIIFAIMIAEKLISMAVNFVITNYILTRHLNLQ